MNRTDSHPDTERLDQLRAGLLDDRPALKAELEAHLGDCPACRRRFNLPASLRLQTVQPDDLQARLDQARRRALMSGRRRLWHTLVPVAAAAAVALVAVLVSNPLQQPDEEIQVAETAPQEVPELYEDLDFYLWLADHKHSGDSAT
jgi:hypothetical protein